MLLALLYTDDGELSAAALACDQQPLGERYWREIHAAQLRSAEAETAYVEIDDEELARKLLAGEFEDPNEAADAVDAYLGVTHSPRRPR